MKQIIPFTKDITFKTKIGELMSISLDNDLVLKGEDLITGNFYVKGSYKMIKTSELEEDYSYKIPCEIAISDEYETFDATIDIDDFNYEIINEEILRVKISVAIDNLSKKEVRESSKEETPDELLLKDDSKTNKLKETKTVLNEENNSNRTCYDTNDTTTCDDKISLNIEPKSEDRDLAPLDIISSTNFDLSQMQEETYSTYSVYIVRENDTIESILDKYKISLLELSDYNDTSNITNGMKLIIPSVEND